MSVRIDLASDEIAVSHSPEKPSLSRCLLVAAGPAPRWKLAGGRELCLGRTRVMAILNVTPDSFSDGGTYLDVGRAVARAGELVDEGADIVDVGGESTRPGAPDVDEAEEQRRVVPVIREIARRLDVPVSVDTRKAGVARAALDAGASIVNDVSGLSADPQMASTVAAHEAGLVLMHMRGAPATMQSMTGYADVLGEVRAELGRSLAYAIDSGILADHVVLDPGIGFAKLPAQNLVLMRNLPLLLELGRPVLVGPSRKSFIGELTGEPVERRLPGTLAAVVVSSLLGARVVRVHDVMETRQALAVADAIVRAS